MPAKNAAFIVGAKRTPFGAFGGALRSFTPVDLGEIASRAALEQANISASHVDHVIFGKVTPTHVHAARQIALRVGVPIETGAYIANRLCGSGFQAVACAAQQIWLGESSIILAGGIECLSQAPFLVQQLRFGSTLGASYDFQDYIHEAHTDRRVNMLMGFSAEMVAAVYGVAREDADALALRSHRLWRHAHSTEHTPHESFTPQEPALKGIGPIPAIRRLLDRSGLKIEDIDLFVINESFAATTLAAQRELGIPMKRLNVNGDSLAIGHPHGATGARISAHIAHELCRRGWRYGIGSTCIGGGQGIAVLFENAQI